MAIMIPDAGPVPNDSISAEPDIYWRLAAQLGASFTVIHSLPWVSSVAREIDGRAVPTGELDFLILHPDFGVLALEIKGGVISYHKSVFVLRNGMRIDPVRQVRRGTHALANWIHNAGGPSLKIGYAIVLPDSDLEGQPVPPALVDQSSITPQNIIFDKNDLRDFGQKIVRLMDFWKTALGNKSPGETVIEKVRNLICPIADYRPKWRSRIQEVAEKWLILTEQQQKYLVKLSDRRRSVLTGRSGTGKTLLAATLARKTAEFGKVLFLVFNTELAKQLCNDLSGINIDVLTFHRLCLNAAMALGENVPHPIPNEWFQNTAPALFRRAITENVLTNQYYSLIMDEAQIFHEEWLRDLVAWFSHQTILACCDETQVFPYETLTPTNRIVEILEAGESFTLTINLRSPRLVFERVQDVYPSTYEQDSRRLAEEDTLDEVAVFNPLKTLYNTLRQLHDEGIEAKHIAVVYIYSKPLFPSDFDEMLNKNLREVRSQYQRSSDYQQAVKRIQQEHSLYEWYYSQRDVETFFARAISIGKFRGLESPVIIVFAVGKLDQASLACAYTRTTTKCIVIYNITSFFKNEDLNILQRIVIRDVQAVRSEVETRWPLEKAMSVVPVIEAFSTIYWSKVWQGWVFWDQGLTEVVATNLWRCHLTEYSNYPSFIVSVSNEPWSVSSINGKDNYRKISYGFDWCDICNSWTRRQKNDNSEYTCMDCKVSNFGVPPKDEASNLQIQARLLTDSMVSKEERRALSPYLKALLYWNLLDEISKKKLIQLLPKGVDAYDDQPYRYLFYLLTGVDILRTPSGKVIKRDELKDKYKQWFPDLKLNDIEMRNELTYGMNYWIQKQLIQKAIKHKSGQYIRVEMKVDKFAA